MTGEHMEVTPALSSAFANYRQGQRSTPRCEPPSDYDKQIAADMLKDFFRFMAVSNITDPRITTLQATVERQAAALAEIRDMTSRRQLPLTTQINDIARKALEDTNG